MKITIVHTVAGEESKIHYTGVKSISANYIDNNLYIRLNRNYTCKKEVNGVCCEKAGKDWLQLNNASTASYFHCIYNVKHVDTY